MYRSGRLNPRPATIRARLPAVVSAEHPSDPATGMAPVPPTPEVRRSLRSNGAFVRVWAAATISNFGSLITRMALPFVAILVIGAGPVEVGLLRSLEVGAALIFGLVAGAWVDRLRRRPVLIGADLGRAALLASIPLAAAGGWLSYPQLLIVTGAAAILAVFFDAADNAYLPTVVEHERLVDANSALAASGSVAETVGFGISGVLIAILTAPITILVDALTFLLSALLLGSIRRPEPAPPPPEAREPVAAEIRHGLSLVRHDPVLRAFAIGTMAHAAGWGFFGATFLLFATEDLGLGPAAIGIIAGIGGIASFGGAVLAKPAIHRFGLGATAVAAMVLAGIGGLFIPLAPAGAPLLAIAFLVGQQLVADSAATAYEVIETSVRQARVDDRELGRVVATFGVAAGFAQLCTTLVGGFLAAAVGLREVLFLGPVVIILGALAMWRSPLVSLRDLPVGVGPDREPSAVVVDFGRDEPIGG